MILLVGAFAANPANAEPQVNNVLMFNVGKPALGVYEPGIPNDLGHVRQLESATRGTFSILHWYVHWGAWNPDFNRTNLEIVRQHGSTPLITWEPWAGVYNDPKWALQAGVLSGRNDAYIRSWAAGLAAYGGPVLLRFGHEMHDSYYPWAVGVNGNSAADYVAAWRHVHDIFTLAHASNVQWVWNPNIPTDMTTSIQYQFLLSSLYPGDEYVDWVGLDVYNSGTNNWSLPYWSRTPSWRSFPDILSEPYEVVGGISARPLLLPEIATAEAGGSKPAWIADSMSPATLSMFPRLQGMVWFDVSKEEYWALGSSPQALLGWIGAAAPLMSHPSQPAPPSPQPAPTAVGYTGSEVSITDDQGFHPATVVVPPGSIVNWVNNGHDVHTVVSNPGYIPSFDSGGLDTGQRFSATFKTPGSFSYHSSTEPIYTKDEIGNTVTSFRFNGTVVVQ